MKTVAIYSSKGGVGKTATAVNLAYAASVSGQRTLLCDMDSQGAASYYFRIKAKKKFNSEKLLDGDIAGNIRGTDFTGLDLLPAHFSFRNLDLALYELSKKNGGRPWPSCSPRSLRTMRSFFWTAPRI
jgi:cellulose biosynthesis protein BcsQ